MAKRCFDVIAHASSIGLVDSRDSHFYFKCSFLYTRNACRLQVEGEKNYYSLLMPDLSRVLR